jgi:hypothetical protein
MATMKLAWAVLGPLVVVAACGGHATAESLCALCPQTDAEREHCIEAYLKDEKLTRERGCGDQWQTMVDCIAEDHKCGWLGPELVPLSSCVPAYKAWYECDGH